MTDDNEEIRILRLFIVRIFIVLRKNFHLKILTLEQVLNNNIFLS